MSKNEKLAHDALSFALPTVDILVDFYFWYGVTIETEIDPYFEAILVSNIQDMFSKEELSTSDCYEILDIWQDERFLKDYEVTNNAMV